MNLESTTGGTMCPRCGTTIPPGISHTCAIDPDYSRPYKTLPDLQAELESERTARREADENRFALWQDEHDLKRNRAIAAEQKVAALIAAVEKHEREPAFVDAPTSEGDMVQASNVHARDKRLYDRVRSISQGDSE